eukprot:symbB.v1.2.002189.t1/scaffold96.1/size336774/6
MVGLNRSSPMVPWSQPIREPLEVSTFTEGFVRCTDVNALVFGRFFCDRQHRVATSGGSPYVALANQAACGADHSLILTTGGSLWSAGRGSEGQLGIEDEVEVVSKFFCSVSSGVAQIASGADHSTYLDFYGGAWSFGENSRGQLGLGHCERVAGPHRMLLPGALAVGIQCGGTHTLILSDTSEVYGCGGNDKGQLGDKDLRPVSLPFKLALPALARRISCGFSHSLILCRTGELWVLGEKRLRRLSELHGKQVRQMSAGGDQCLLWATERRKSKASEAILLSFNVNTEDLNVVNVSP